MKISAVSFGRTPIMKCTIKKTENRGKVEATLYKMDAKDKNDLQDVEYSKVGRCMYDDMAKEFDSPSYSREFYMLQNDKTKEVISCAQTSHRFRTSDKNPGLSTLIEEIGVSKNYVNGAEPLLAYIAYNAFNRFDDTVYTAFRPEEIPVDMKRAKFSQTKLGEWYIPQKRYHVLIDSAQRHSQMEFLS